MHVPVCVRAVVRSPVLFGMFHRPIVTHVSEHFALVSLASGVITCLSVALSCICTVIGHLMLFSFLLMGKMAVISIILWCDIKPDAAA